MIRSLIGWAIQTWLSRSLPRSAAAITKALLLALDEMRERGENGVTVEGTKDRPRIVIHPHDPGAKPVTLDDILRGDQA